MPRTHRPRGPGGPDDNDDQPHPIDIHVGSRIRLRRNMQRISQEKLGEALGLTFQQIQKYERGANRVGASRLWELSRVLDVPVQFFFDSVDPVRAPAIPGGFAEPPAEAFEADPTRKQETVDLVEAYYHVPDQTIRRKLLDLLKALGAAEQPQPAPNRRGRKRRPPPTSGLTT